MHIIKKNIFIRLLLLYLAMSSLFIALLYNLTNEVNWIVFKDLPIYLTFIVMFFLKKTIKIDFLSFLFPLAFIIIYNFLISPAPLFAQITSIRQILIPFVLVFIAQNFVFSSKSYLDVAKFIVFLSLGLIAFGFFERFTYLWTVLDISNFFDAKNIPMKSYGYPTMFIEPIKIPFFSGVNGSINGFPRMVSTVLDPINFGHLMVTVFIVVWYESNRFKFSTLTKFFLLLIIFSALLLSVSKGAWLQLFIVLVLFNQKMSMIIKFLLLIAFLPFIVVFIQMHPGFMLHFKGFISIFDSLNIFGHGLSTYGNYSKMFNSELQISNTGVGDSFWGSLLGQLGLVGFIAWLYPFYKIIMKVSSRHYLSKLLIAQILVSALSENTFNVLSVAFLMILIGIYYEEQKYNIMEKYK